MASSNIKLFDENKGNMLNDTEFNISTQRLNGLQTGVASSQLQNKAMYQTSLVAYAIAQIMMQNGKNANDTDAVSAFVNNLSASIVQKKLDKASANDIAGKIAGKWVDAKQLGDFKANVEDNYLPLLGGTMTGDLFLNRDPVSSLQAATKNYVDGKDLKLYTGQYTGTGTYGATNPNSVTIPFRPILFIAPYSRVRKQYASSEGYWQQGVMVVAGTSVDSKTYNKIALGSSSHEVYIYLDADGKTIKFYSDDDGAQQNKEGIIYKFAAIGGYDMGGGN